MIVEELRVRNWRSYREWRSFSFGPGMNLLVGPNEAGKSTLFEALQRALFDRHASKAKDLRRVQPLGSSLAPEVELVFRTGGVRYRVHKRFLVEPFAELHAERAGRFERDHEGDQADARLRELLGGRPSSRATEARHRGLAQALWYLQSEEGLPRKSWSDAVQQGLSGLVRTALRTPREERIVARILNLYEETFTATGRYRSSAPIVSLSEEVERLEEELRKSSSELARSATLRGELEGLEVESRRVRGQLEAARRRRQELLAGIRLGEELEQEKERRERSLEATSETNRKLATAREEMLQRRERRVQVEAALEASVEREEALRREVRRHRRNAEGHARHWETQLEPQLKGVARELEDLQAKLRLQDLERERDRVRALIERRARLDTEVAELRGRLESLAAPEAPLVEEAEALAAEAGRLEARASAAAIQVTFELADHAVSTDPETPLEEGAFLVTRPTTFDISGVGRVRVRSRDGALERDSREAEEKRRRLAEILARHSCRDPAALRELYERRREVEGKLRELVVQAEELALDPETEPRRLREVEQELRLLRERSPQQVLPGIEGWAKDRTAELLGDLEQRRRELETAIAEERSAEHEAQRLCLERDQELRESITRSAELRAAIEVFEEELAKQIAPFGSWAELQRRCDESDAELARVREERRAFLAEYREKVAQPRQELGGLEVEIEELQRQLGRLEAEAADRLGRLEEIAGLGLYTSVGDLEGKLERRRRRLGVLEERAEAVRILAELMTAFQDAEARQLEAPLAALLDPWLRRLSGETYDGIALDQGLMPTAASSRLYDSPVPIDSLSFGTQEQIVVLLRLAMGVLLSAEERQLVVLDDRLVNADEVRMGRLLGILEEASERCQILLATCHERPYRNLGAHTLHLDVETPVLPEPVADGG